MTRKTKFARPSRRTVTAGLAASALAGVSHFNIVRAQTGPLKVGVLLPRSGFQAVIARTARGVDITTASSIDGHAELHIRSRHRTTSTWRARGRKRMPMAPASVGALRLRPVDAIARSPRKASLLHPHRSGPQITGAGYSACPHFPTAPMISDAFANQKRFAATAGTETRVPARHDTRSAMRRASIV